MSGIFIGLSCADERVWNDWFDTTNDPERKDLFRPFPSAGRCNVRCLLAGRHPRRRPMLRREQHGSELMRRSRCGRGAACSIANGGGESCTAAEPVSGVHSSRPRTLQRTNPRSVSEKMCNDDRLFSFSDSPRTHHVARSRITFYNGVHFC